MCHMANVIEKVMVVFFLSLIAVTVRISHLIHDKVNVRVVCILMDGIDDLVFASVMLDNFVRILLGKFWRDTLGVTEA